jgi:predicted ATP-dependent endonuclease of OLD family
MRLIKARVQNYRSIIDSDYFDVEFNKTLLVGPNEAGKTAILQALQKLNPPEGIAKFEALRDYPRSKYNDITTGKVKLSDIIVVEGQFKLTDDELSEMPDGFKEITYVFQRKMDNSAFQTVINGSSIPTYAEIEKDLKRLLSHIEERIQKEIVTTKTSPKESLDAITSTWGEKTTIDEGNGSKLNTWLAAILSLIDEKNETEEKRYDKLKKLIETINRRNEAIKKCNQKLPVFILFSNYFRVKPAIHLEHLADRIDRNLLDDDQYDYGNTCLLKLLGFSARNLSNLGKAQTPQANQPEALKAYRDQLDTRSYQLNAASVKLTAEIKKVWNPNPEKAEATKLKVVADGQYLKVVVEDDLGVDIELDQRSEGFQWLVSFFIVFFAESSDKHKNAILLLDEPGLSLHGLKQREFRLTISRLSDSNQTIFTTHSPFLVGPDELQFVRVVEMVTRDVGTKVHSTIFAGDSAALLPLQEALGYDLAQSLFMQSRNLVLEGLTDYWYIITIAGLAKEAKKAILDEKTALVPAQSASKVVYFATILHAHELKVAALLDSDNAGEQAAKQDVLVHTLGNKKIIRTKDIYKGTVHNPEIEDLFRTTLLQIAKEKFGKDVEKIAATQNDRPIIDIFTQEIADFSKYKLAKGFIKWSENHSFSDLAPDEISGSIALIERINNSLK